MHHKFEDILAHVSNEETVYAGEFFGSGTVGSGCGLEHGKFFLDRVMSSSLRSSTSGYSVTGLYAQID